MCARQSAAHRSVRRPCSGSRQTRVSGGERGADAPATDRRVPARRAPWIEQWDVDGAGGQRRVEKGKRRMGKRASKRVYGRPPPATTTVLGGVIRWSCSDCYRHRRPLIFYDRRARTRVCPTLPNGLPFSLRYRHHSPPSLTGGRSPQRARKSRSPFGSHIENTEDASRTRSARRSALHTVHIDAECYHEAGVWHGPRAADQHADETACRPWAWYYRRHVAQDVGIDRQLSVVYVRHPNKLSISSCHLPRYNSPPRPVEH